MTDASKALVLETQLFRDVAEEARFRQAAIVESSDDAIVSGNLDGIIVTWNAGAQKIYGYTEAEALGKPITILVPPELPDEEKKILERLRAGGRIAHFETIRVSKTGEKINVSLTISPIKDSSGRTVGSSGIARDITERKRSERELASANERLHLAIEAGSVGGWDFDLKTGKNLWFGKAHGQLGMAHDETLGSKEEFWDRVHKDDRERLGHALQVAKDKRQDFAEDFRVVWKDGTTHWLRSRGRYHYAANGEPERMLGISVDITEGKQAEQALRESEQRFRLAVQAGKMYSFEWDVMTGAVMRSPEHVNVLGVAEPLRCTHQQFVDRIHPDDRPKFIDTITGLTPEYPSGDVTYRVQVSDGGFVWLRSSGRGFFDGEGRMLRVIGMVADVTDQKLAEEALRVSEERLRLAQWAAHIGTFDLNIRTGVDIWQPETEALYGLPPGGFGGTLTAFEDLIHPNDRERVIHLTGEMMRTGQPAEGEWRAVWSDGSVHWIAGRGQVLMDECGEPSRMLGVNIDVTERKLAEEKLREYERAVEGVEEAIVVVDREYRCQMANRAFLKRRNLNREQVVGRFVHEFVGKDVYETVVKAKLDECFQGKIVRYELKYKYRDLGERDLFASYYPVEGSNGVDRVACIVQDITDRKQAEKALVDMSRKLMEAQEQERIRIARELHDDINQRLALLSIELETSKRNASSGPDMSLVLAEVRERIDEISSQVQSISHQLHSSQLEYLGIVAAIKSFSREFGERQKVQVDFRHDDIPKLVSNNVSLCLFRVLQEALHNAVKHSKVRHFKVMLNRLQDQLQLTVSDRGVGFDPEKALSLGGLGLISMRERVRLVNGTISIESKPMGGTTIHVSVPLDSDLGERFGSSAENM